MTDSNEIRQVSLVFIAGALVTPNRLTLMMDCYAMHATPGGFAMLSKFMLYSLARCCCSVGLGLYSMTLMGGVVID